MHGNCYFVVRYWEVQQFYTMNVPIELNNLYEVDTERYPLLKSQSAKMLVNIPKIQLVKYGIEDKIAF